ncbi:hypothetical protein H6G81_14620 [Scytonema hofmannii FACHB-248]|uniref:Uncharacterized protein n=1 Tax=Scytonema hofmannii FACHB-248 TaxID=1842502 RepID=A0ABR8GQR4_9CYAN|nr:MULTISPECIES: hypothetical protein [Nostocales]MBD2605726.1 hypothetical protein [Scytonema hofmannii FACHB-248]
MPTYLSGSNGLLIGIVGVADTLKPEAYEAVAALSKERVKVVLLTRDN